MPIPTRQAFRLNCRGINLATPIDQLPPADYPFLQNVRVLQQGSLESRPGQSPLFAGTMADSAINSVRRLNDLIETTNYIRVIGAGGSLYAQTAGADPVLVDSGYSGNPLSMVPFRPEQSPNSWMYIGDYARMRKINVAGDVRTIGLEPPTVAPDAEISSAYFLNIDDAGSSGSFTTTGTASALTSQVRVPGGTTIQTILFDSGATGFATIVPSTTGGDSSWLGQGSRLVMGGSETQTVLQVLTPIKDTTIAGIEYDAGATGLCTIVLTVGTVGLERNSMVTLGGAETVRVLSVSVGPDGLYSFRCATVATFSAGVAVAGLVSFRIFCTVTHAAGASLADSSVGWTTAVGVGQIAKTGALDLSEIFNRPIQQDDYMHISLRFDVVANVVSGRLLLDVDAATNDFTQNYYQKEFFQVDLATAGDAGAGDNAWVELTFRLSDLERIGADTTRNFKNVAAIGIELTVSDTTVAQFSAWWVGGGFGPDVALGSPIGLVYRYRYRDSTTGAKSVPGPATRYELFPHRQSVNVFVSPSANTAVDSIDIERLDPNLQSPVAPAQFTYVGTVPNAATFYFDDLVAQLIAANPPLETNVLQPFPILGVPLTGVINVTGTTVTWVSGDQFPTNLVAGTAILIDGVAFQTYGQPTATMLELTRSASLGAGVTYNIASPVLAGTGLPYVFGPLSGPTAAFLFALGDVKNAGTLYWTNGNDPDSAADTNSIEITPPSEPLVSGAVWKTYVFVATRDRLFMIQPTFDQPNLFTPIEIATGSGVWNPWAMAPGVDGVYFEGRDGLYKATPYYGGQNVSKDLWPIFPHEGEAGVQTNGIAPPDMQSAVPHRISVADADVYFDYTDTDGNLRTFKSVTTNSGSLRQDQGVAGWFWYAYATGVNLHYWEESPYGTTPLLLQATQAGMIMESTGLADGATEITCIAQTPSLVAEDTRAQKLYVDSITDMDGVATLEVGLNFNETVLPAITIGAVPRGQAIANLDSVAFISPVTIINLPLFINISARYTFTAGTKLYEFQPSFYPQPYVVENLVTQFTDHAIPGWKHCRYARFMYISASPLLLTITTSENTTFQYTLPAHLGHANTFDFNIQQLQKARLFAYDWKSLDCSPFTPFLEETYIRMKKWGGEGDFNEVLPFIR